MFISPPSPPLPESWELEPDPIPPLVDALHATVFKNWSRSNGSSSLSNCTGPGSPASPPSSMRNLEKKEMSFNNCGNKSSN